jgi:hypothetical protein
MEDVGSGDSAIDAAAESASASAEQTVGAIASKVAHEDGVRRVEVVVTKAESGANLSMIWTVGILLVVGLGAATMMLTKDGGGSGSDGYNAPECADGIDNDGGGKKDGNDPDCYSNPELWEGYDPNRRETNAANDPPN